MFTMTTIHRSINTEGVDPSIIIATDYNRNPDDAKKRTKKSKTTIHSFGKQKNRNATKAVTQCNVMPTLHDHIYF